MNEKQIRILATIATIASICMYTSYIFQIQANLAGHKGNPIQPLCAAINCTLWVAYGLFKKQRDWPIAIANSPGVVLGLITCITSLYTPQRQQQKDRWAGHGALTPPTRGVA